MHGFSSLRFRLSLLVLVAVAPAFGLIAYSALEERRDALAYAQSDATRLAAAVAREYRQILFQSRQLLFSLAKLPQLHPRAERSFCNGFLADLLKVHSSNYLNLGAIAPDGNLYCSALPMDRATNLADRTYFRRAVETHSFAVGDYQVGYLTGRPSVNLAFPLLSPSGDLIAVLFLAIDLSSFGRLVSDSSLPSGSTLNLLDNRGTVLAHYPYRSGLIGTPVTAREVLAAIESGRPTPVVKSTGLDGVQRVYVIAPMHAGLPGTLYTVVGIPENVVLAGANRALTRNLMLMGMAMLLVLAAAWGGGSYFVMRHVRRLTDAATRLGQGDLTARSGIPHGLDELGQMAKTFDRMAEGLQARDLNLQRLNRALKTMGGGNRALLRAREEVALLRDMCRVAVETGGYTMAWVGYAEHDPEKTLRPVAHAGAGNGFLESLHATWADTERGRGLAGSAIRAGKPCVSNDVSTDPNLAPWRDDVLKSGFASGIALPLVDGEVIGALSIYAAEPNAFDQDEIELLDEMALDLSFGIETLRIRVRERQAVETIRRIAYEDALTGLPNRARLSERLEQAIAEANARTALLAVLAVNVDGFRDIQDAIGYRQANALLKEIAARLRSVVREGDLAARLGSDEFAILLSQAGTETAIDMAHRVQNVIEPPFESAGFPLDVRASIGISVYPEHGLEPDVLLLRADIAGRVARHERHGFAVYSGRPDQESPRRLALVSELRRAIDADRLALHYQPKVDARTGRVCGAEALVRWPHPDRGMVPPVEFIPLAERSGLIAPLTYWVLSAALRQAAAWRKEGLAVPIAVNLSAHNLRDPRIVERIRGLLDTWDVPPELLQIEITESTLMEDYAIAAETLGRLGEMGIKIFIDDFGTGYSSLSHISSLPVSALKIDRCFITNLVSSADSASLVSTIISLAHSLQLKVVAEGVENAEQARFLELLRCDELQGYHLSRPLAAEQFREWLRNF